MNKIYEVNIMENKKLVWGLNFLAVVLVVPIGFLFAMIGVLLGRSSVTTGEFTLLSMAYLFVIYFALIIIHEFIHGVFFKVFCPEILSNMALSGNQGWPMRPVRVHCTIVCRCWLFPWLHVWSLV